jgi:protein-disulfide isomerase
MKEETITMKKSTIWQVSTGILAILFIVSLSTGGFGNCSGAAVVNNNAGNQPSQPSVPTGVATVNAEDYVDDDAYLGDEDAPVTIIEFSDYECPYCKRHHDQTFDLIKENYIDTGKVKYVYRDFTPTLVNPSYHPNAVNAAMAVECVGKLEGNDAYFKMADKVFDNQGSNSIESLKTIASGLGYNINNCLDSEEMKSEVENDFEDGRSAGGNGTPYFIIGNIPLSGAQPFSAFQQAIEAQL